MIEMLNRSVIPSCEDADCGPIDELKSAVETLEAAVANMHDAEDPAEMAQLARVLRLETMISIRETIDGAEKVVPAADWTLPTYTDMLFLDQTTKLDYEN